MWTGSPELSTTWSRHLLLGLGAQKCCLFPGRLPDLAHSSEWGLTGGSEPWKGSRRSEYHFFLHHHLHASFLLSWAPSWHGGLDFDNLCFWLCYCLCIQNWANGFVHPYFLQISHLVAILLTLVPITRNTLPLPLLVLLLFLLHIKTHCFPIQAFSESHQQRGVCVHFHRNVYKASPCPWEPL